MAVFENPANGYRVRVGFLGPMLFSFLFGPFYFMYKGCWRHAFLGMLFGALTLGVSWLLVYPFLAPGIVGRSYLERGWKKVEREGGTGTTGTNSAPKPRPEVQPRPPGMAAKKPTGSWMAQKRAQQKR